MKIAGNNTTLFVSKLDVITVLFVESGNNPLLEPLLGRRLPLLKSFKSFYTVSSQSAVVVFISLTFSFTWNILEILKDPSQPQDIAH